MKSPSRNISTSLAGQRIPGRTPEPVRVGRQRKLTAASMALPGEGCVSPPPGKEPAATASRYASANGRRYGGGA